MLDHYAEIRGIRNLNGGPGGLLDLDFPNLLDLSFAHLVTQTEVQGKVRDALAEMVDAKVGLGGMRSDPASISIEPDGQPTVSPLNAPMVVNNRTIAELDDMLDFLKTSSAERATSVDPLLGGEE